MSLRATSLSLFAHLKSKTPERLEGGSWEVTQIKLAVWGLGWCVLGEMAAIAVFEDESSEHRDAWLLCAQDPVLGSVLQGVGTGRILGSHLVHSLSNRSLGASSGEGDREEHLRSRVR